jgi:hypothetical protein
MTEKAENMESILRLLGECVGRYCGLNIISLSYNKEKHKNPQCFTWKLRLR